MSADLDEFFARTRSAADAIDIPRVAEVRRRGDRRRHRQTVMVLVTVFTAVAATLGGVTLAARKPSVPHPASTNTPMPMPSTPPKGFATVHQVGTPFVFGAAGRDSTALTLASGGIGFAAWRTKTPDALVLARVDLGTSRLGWGPVTIDAPGDWSGLSVATDANVLVAVSVAPQSADADPVRTTFVDIGTGQPLWHTGSILFVGRDVVVAREGADFVARGIRDGRRLWRYAGAPDRTAEIAPTDGTAEPSAYGPPVVAANTVAVLDPDGLLGLFDVHTGPTDEGRFDGGKRVFPVGSHIAGTMRGEVYVTTPVGRKLEIQGVNSHGVRSVYKGEWVPESLVTVTRCLDTYLCFAEGTDLVALDPGRLRVVWRTALGLTPYAPVTQVGAAYLVVGGRTGDDRRYQVLDRHGQIVVTYTPPQDQRADILRDGVILGPTGVTPKARVLQFAAITRDGAAGLLGRITGTGLCTAEDSTLLCLDDTGITTWSLR